MSNFWSKIFSKNSLLTGLMAALAACSKTSPDTAATPSNAQSNPALQSSTPLAGISKDNDCNAWDFSKHVAFSAFREIGINVTLRCDLINRNINNDSLRASAWKRFRIPSALESLYKNLSAIRNLRRKPKSIEVSGYFLRDLGDARWVIRATIDAQKEMTTAFVEREAAFQSIEDEVFSDKVVLLSPDLEGTDPAFNNNFFWVPPSEATLSNGQLAFPKEYADSLTAAQKQLAEFKDSLLLSKVKLVMIPTPIAARDFDNTSYSSRDGLMVLPYASGPALKSVKEFIDKVVPLENQLKEKLSGIEVTSLTLKHLGDYYDYEKKIRRYLRIITELSALADDIKPVIEKRNLTKLYLDTVGNHLFSPYQRHELSFAGTPQINGLNIHVSRQLDRYTMQFIDQDSTRACLRYLASNSYDPSDTSSDSNLCKAKYIEEK